MATGDQFVLSLTGNTTKMRDKMDLAVRKIVLDVGTRVVMRSPVGDGSHWKNPPPKGYTGGHFRANWQYGDGTVPTGVLSAIDKSGFATIGRISAQIKPQAAGKVHYLTNNLPYAMKLETGWSRQAPQGMVGLTVREFQGIVARIAKEVSA